MSCGNDAVVRIWSPFDHRLIAECAGLPNPPVHVAVAPDNARILLCTSRGNPRILAADTGTTLLELDNSRTANSLWRGAVALEGERLVAAEHLGGVHVWTTSAPATR